MPYPSNLSNHPGWSLDRRDPVAIQRWMPIWEWLYRYYFRVETSGWEHIPDEQVLIVGSHNGGLASPDMVMMIYDWFRHFGPDRLVYGLMHYNVWEGLPFLAELAMPVGAIMAHPKMALAAIHKGASVLVYPGGPQDVFRPHSLRHKIYMADNQAFVKLALRENLPIVPAISYGAHDTLIVLVEIYKQMEQLHRLGMPWFLGIDPKVFPIYLGLPWGLAIGPLPNIPFPTKIYTRVCPVIRFERSGREAAQDRDYVDDCYQLVCHQMQQELDALVAEVEQADRQKP